MPQCIVVKPPLVFATMNTISALEVKIDFQTKVSFFLKKGVTVTSSSGRSGTDVSFQCRSVVATSISRLLPFDLLKTSVPSKHCVHPVEIQSQLLMVISESWLCLEKWSTDHCRDHGRKTDGRPFAYFSDSFSRAYLENSERCDL